MTRPLARALTLLYAPSWRLQYGAEFEALLTEMPCTPSVLADIVPRALATRKPAGAFAAMSLLLLCIAGSNFTHMQQPAQVANHTEHRPPALAACLSYSSLARSGIIARQQCLD